MTASQQSTQLPPPPLMWAQRVEEVLVTVNLEDCKEPIIKFEKDSIYFKGVGGTDKKEYEVTVPLYAEIDAELSKSFNRGRCIELILIKADQKAPFWPSLTKDKKKHHYIKCDFNKWKDEDDSDQEGAFGAPKDMDFENLMRSMGGIGGAGDKDGAPPSMDDLELPHGDSDSDDESLPELE